MFCFYFPATKRMSNQLEVITNNSQRLSNLTEELNSGLNKSRTNLTEITTECSSKFPGQDFCNSVDTSSLAAEANFTNLPDVSAQLSNVQEVVNQDFEKSAREVWHFNFVRFLVDQFVATLHCHKYNRELKQWQIWFERLLISSYHHCTLAIAVVCTLASALLKGYCILCFCPTHPIMRARWFVEVFPLWRQWDRYQCWPAVRLLWLPLANPSFANCLIYCMAINLKHNVAFLTIVYQFLFQVFSGCKTILELNWYILAVWV